MPWPSTVFLSSVNTPTTTSSRQDRAVAQVRERADAAVLADLDPAVDVGERVDDRVLADLGAGVDPGVAGIDDGHAAGSSGGPGCGPA